MVVDGSATVLTALDTRHEVGAGEIAYMRDPGGSLTINDVASSAFARQFQPADRSPLVGYTKDVIWLRLTLQRAAQAPSEWLLEFNNPYINDLRAYSPASNGFSVAQAGDRFPFAEREIAFHNPVFRLSLPDTDSRSFYFRLQSDSTLATQLLLWQPAVLDRSGQLELMLFGCILGMVFMSLLSALVHWQSSRNSELLFYSGLCLVTLVFVPAQIGLMAQFVFPRTPIYADLLVPWTLGGTAAAIPVVFGKLLDVSRAFPRIALWLRAVTVVALLLPLTREVDLYWSLGGPILQGLFMVSLLTTGWLSWHRWRNGLEGAGLFLAAHIVLVCSLLVSRLMLLGFLPINALIHVSWVPGLLAFLLLVQAGIVIDNRVALRERRAAKLDAQLARELAESEKILRREQSVFFALVAHELRTPLAIILTGLNNLVRDLVNIDEKTGLRIKRLTRAAERLRKMVERHLNLQRLESADFSRRLIAVSPQNPASEALADVREAFPKRVFELVCAPDVPPLVHVDPELITFSLGNLLANAAKYSPEPTPIILEIAADTCLHYRVIDQGCGIPADELADLFVIFKRSPAVQNKTGFGIGLATVKRIAAAHGGALSYSEAVKGGSIFTLTLPFHPDPEDPSS